MRILIIVPDDQMGGAEQYLKMIAAQWLKGENLVYVFFLRKEQTGIWNELQGENLYLHYGNSLKGKKGVLDVIRNIRYYRNSHFDYVFSSHVFCTALIGVLCKLKQITAKHFVARESTSIFKRFKGLKLFLFKCFYHLGYSSIDLLICQTDYMKKQLIEALPWLDKKVKIEMIPNPIDLADINIKSQEKLDKNINYQYIVSAGRLIPEKGYDILIKAFIKFKKDNKELKLIILGAGKLKDSLEKIIEKYEMKEDIILCGSVKNVYPFFRHSKMCIVSSRIEGFPNVLLQMMSQNEKVVSTLCAGGINQLEGVFTCKTNDEEDLLRAMKECLVADTSPNRDIFNKELQNRSIDKFIERIKVFQDTSIQGKKILVGVQNRHPTHPF